MSDIVDKNKRFESYEIAKQYKINYNLQNLEVINAANWKQPNHSSIQSTNPSTHINYFKNGILNHSDLQSMFSIPPKKLFS